MSGPVESTSATPVTVTLTDEAVGLYQKLAAMPLGMRDEWRVEGERGKPLLYGRSSLIAYGTIGTWDEFRLIAALVNALHDVVPAAHPDDLAVDRLAGFMKRKLAFKREQGRSGWDDKSACSNEQLSQMLREHVDKGDPLDVINLAMMIHARDEKIAPAQSTTQGLFGPYGHLNGPRFLAEDSWAIESDPIENSDEYFSIPLYSLVEPVFPVSYGTPEAEGASPAPAYLLLGLDAATIEACARLIEENIVQDTSAGKVLKPRQDGNRDGLAYAAAIRSLVTNHGSKSDLHPEYVTSADGTDHGYKSTLYPGNVSTGGDV